MSLFFSVLTHVKFTRVKEKEIMYERPRVNVKVERGSIFTFTRQLPYTVYFIYARKIYVRTHVQNDATVEIHLKTIKRKIEITPIEQERLKNRTPKQ